METTKSRDRGGRRPAPSAPRARATGPVEATEGPAERRRAGHETGEAVTVRVRELEPPEHLFRRLLGAYLGGARQLVVVEESGIRPATQAVVRSFCRRTRGSGIVSEGAREMRAIILEEDGDLPLGPRLRRMAEAVLALHRDAVASWIRLPLGEDDSWERRDDLVDREAWYIQREAALRIGTGDFGSLDVWTIARSLERIADHAVTLGEAGRRLAALPRSPGTLISLEQFHQQAMAHLEGALTTTGDGAANDLLDTGEALLASGRALADRLLPAVNGGSMPPATAAAVARIVESIARTIAYGQDIAQVVLDRAMEVPRAPAGPVEGDRLAAV